MKIGKLFLAGLMAVTMAGSAACTVGNDNNANNTENTQTQNPNSGKTYTVTLELNGGKLKDGEDITSYVAGKAVTLPTPTKDGYTFDGWYVNRFFSGTKVTEISADTSGNMTYYAKFDKISTSDDEGTGGSGSEGTGGTGGSGNEGTGGNNNPSNPHAPQTYTVTLNLNGGTLAAGSNVTSYTAGTAVTLPIPTRSGFTFGGWFDNADCSGTAIVQIPASATGNKTYYAAWTAIATEGAVTISQAAGYEEGLYAEIASVSGLNDNDYKVYYKIHDGASAWVKIDSELVRTSGDFVRADVLGLSAGSYDIKVEAAGKTASTRENIAVTAYDRTGYAHFKYTDGVGAYKDDGTPKDDAIIVYVNESNKNSVTVDGISGEGIVAIMKNANTISKPLIVRVLGQVSAATWHEISYDDDMTKDPNDKNKLKLKAEDVKGANGKSIVSDSDIINAKDQRIDDTVITAKGYNSFDESKYTKLTGLTNRIMYSAGKSGKFNELDSYYNMLDVQNLKDVTLEGVGCDAKIFQWGLTWKNCNSIEVRNLTFEAYTEDACSFEGPKNGDAECTELDQFKSNNIWLHHNTFLRGHNVWDVCAELDKGDGDGATDFKRNADVTISYNHYYNNHKTGLIGGSDTQTTANVTFHHNWYQQCESRLPLARQANMHMYNNYYDHSTSSNMSIRANGYAFIEYCYFDNAKNPIEAEPNSSPNGYVKLFNCTFEGISYAASNYITVVTKREDTVVNDNIFFEHFDTDPDNFYYDATAKKTITKSGFEMLSTDQVKTQIPLLAGVHVNKK